MSSPVAKSGSGSTFLVGIIICVVLISLCAGGGYYYYQKNGNTFPFLTSGSHVSPETAALQVLYSKHAGHATNAESALTSIYAESAMYVCPSGVKPSSGLCSLATAYGLAQPFNAWYAGEWNIVAAGVPAATGDRAIPFTSFVLNSNANNANPTALLNSSSNGAFALINFPIKGEFNVSWRVRPSAAGTFSPYLLLCNGRGLTNAPFATNVANMNLRMGEQDASGLYEATCHYNGVCAAGDSMYVALWSATSLGLPANNGTTLRVSLVQALFSF